MCNPTIHTNCANKPFIASDIKVLVQQRQAKPFVKFVPNKHLAYTRYVVLVVGQCLPRSAEFIKFVKRRGIVRRNGCFHIDCSLHILHNSRMLKANVQAFGTISQ
jgi:hypothetical protein